MPPLGWPVVPEVYPIVERESGGHLGDLDARFVFRNQVAEGSSAFRNPISEKNNLRYVRFLSNSDEIASFILGGDNRLGAAVIDDELHLFGSEHHIEGIDDRPDLQHGVVTDNPFPAIARVEGDAVAPSNTGSGKSSRGPVRQIVEFPE